MAKLSIVSTPIGNLEDITIRAIKTIFSADFILCEDTRRTGLLIQELTNRYAEFADFNPDWKPKLISYYDQIEEKRLPEIIDILMKGNDLALVSDAGTPLISDPGYRLVRECVKRNIHVESVPGPSAVLAALTASGLPTDRFFFLGYSPEKQSQRLKIYKELPDIAKRLEVSFLVYCAPHKLASTLTDMKDVWGDISIVIARELTKIHEQVWRGSLSQAIQEFADPKGEIVIAWRFP